MSNFPTTVRETLEHKIHRELDKYDRVELDTVSGDQDFMAINQILEVLPPVLAEWHTLALIEELEDMLTVNPKYIKVHVKRRADELRATLKETP